ncbi:hypothetical protein [Chitinophaga rhizophila]|uniref:Uncharacterized protein n=1 Tax=Chitinophaga rhizophila TaxID=2866212 RepID=A0ABS7G9T8_9BACT|nr:hypothetical protein [Chitinophaga rhizophila]MBW8683564.1 hypothetical protein [Chitinophaga rhizophila]
MRRHSPIENMLIKVTGKLIEKYHNGACTIVAMNRISYYLVSECRRLW